MTRLRAGVREHSQRAPQGVACPGATHAHPCMRNTLSSSDMTTQKCQSCYNVISHIFMRYSMLLGFMGSHQLL